MQGALGLLAIYGVRRFTGSYSRKTVLPVLSKALYLMTRPKGETGGHDGAP